MSSAVREDTTSVVRPLGSIDSDGDGLLLDSSLEGRGGLGDISETLKTV